MTGRDIARWGQTSALQVRPPATSVLRASFVQEAGRTRLDRVFESGALRLRQPRGPASEGIIVNTGGGIVAGDRIALDIDLAAGSAVTVTSVAAEKIYRSAGHVAEIDATLRLGPGSRLDWLPQETILFDGARLTRRFTIDMVEDATLLAAEIVVFGRLARGEAMRDGSLRDSWRVRRGGRLVFADETRIEGEIAATLDRKAVGGGARAMALLLLAGLGAEAALEPIRAALSPFAAGEAHVESGASSRDGILVARLLASSPERLRAAMIAALGALRSAPLPRIWV